MSGLAFVPTGVSRPLGAPAVALEVGAAAGFLHMLFRIIEFSDTELAITGNLPREVAHRIVAEVRGARMLYRNVDAVTITFPPNRERLVRGILEQDYPN
jgi:hypothetical protein